MMRIWATAFLLASGGMAVGETITASATDPYVDTASGVSFPVSAGAFQRVRLERTSAAAIKAGYAHAVASERVTVTVSVDQPKAADGSCQKTVEADRAAAAKRPGVVFEIVPSPVAGWDTGGYGANGPGSVGGQEHHYYCQGGWVIQFSFQHAPEVEAEALETAFLAGFPLPEKH